MILLLLLGPCRRVNLLTLQACDEYFIQSARSNWENGCTIHLLLLGPPTCVTMKDKHFDTMQMLRPDADIAYMPALMLMETGTKGLGRFAAQFQSSKL